VNDSSVVQVYRSLSLYKCPAVVGMNRLRFGSRCVVIRSTRKMAVV